MSESITASSVVGVTAIVSVAAPTSPACAPSWGGRTTLDSGPSTLPIVGEEVTAIRGGADPCGVRSFDDLHIERGLYAGTRGGLNSSGQGQDHVGLRALTPLLTAGQDGCYPEEASPKSAVTGLQFSLDVLRVSMHMVSDGYAVVIKKALFVFRLRKRASLTNVYFLPNRNFLNPILLLLPNSWPASCDTKREEERRGLDGIHTGMTQRVSRCIARRLITTPRNLGKHMP